MFVIDETLKIINISNHVTETAVPDNSPVYEFVDNDNGLEVDELFVQ